MGSNLLVAQAIAASVKSLLGPYSSVKCCVAEEGSTVICSSAAKVLECIDLQHPAGYVINDACQSLLKKTGSGCKTFLCLCGFWARNVQSLQEQGVPIPAIVKHFREALNECEQLVDELAVPLAFLSGKTADVPRTILKLVSGSGVASSGTNKKGAFTLPSKRGEFVSSSMRLYQENVTGTRRQPILYEPGSVRYGSLSTRGAAINTCCEKHRTLVRGSRHFAGNVNVAGQLASEGSSAVETTQHYDTSARHVKPETELQAVRGSVKSLLDSLGESLCHGKETEMKLAVQVVYSQFVNSRKRSVAGFQVDKKMIQMESIVGPPVHASQILSGVLLKSCNPAQELYAHLDTKPQGISVVLVNNEVTPHCQHFGYKPTASVSCILHESDVSPGTVSDEILWVRRVIRVFQVYKIDALLTKGAVHDSIVDYCISSKILVVQNVSSSTLQLLGRATGATLISYLENARSSDIGKASRVEPWGTAGVSDGSAVQAEHAYYVVLEGPRGLPVQTAVLCGACMGVLHDTEIKLRNCLSRLTNALACGRAVPGAGGSEVACIARLQQLTGSADTTFKPLVYDSFARGLQEMLVNTFFNSGRYPSHQHCLNYVLSRRKFSPTNTASCGTEEAAERPYEPAGEDSGTALVLDDYLAKRAAWRRAVDVVCLLVQTDMLVVTSPRGHHLHAT